MSGHVVAKSLLINGGDVRARVGHHHMAKGHAFPHRCAMVSPAGAVNQRTSPPLNSQTNKPYPADLAGGAKLYPGLNSLSGLRSQKHDVLCEFHRADLPVI